MASASSAPSDKEDQVVVVLAAHAPGPHFVEPERRITFTRETSVIHIGRASKVPTKGFVAAADNAWFDSPVMSRRHAELSVDFNTKPKSIYIKDVSSLHGTFHKRGDGSDGLGKEDKLEPGQIVKLESGDTLRFGIDIYRSKETFPPCHVDFLIEEIMERPIQAQPSKPEAVSARCFSVSVPEDDFDDEDYMSDSDGVMEIDTSLPPHGNVCSQSLLSRGIGRGPAIDLTLDVDVPTSTQTAGVYSQSSAAVRVATDSDVIDLTSEPEQASEPDQDNGPRRIRRQSTPFYMGPLMSSFSIVSNMDAGTSSAKPNDVATSDLHTSSFIEGLTRAAQVTASENYFDKDFEPSKYAEDDISSESGSDSPSLNRAEDDINLTDSDDHSVLSVESPCDLSSQDSDVEGHDSVSSELGDEYGAAMDDFEDEDEDLHYTDSSPSSADAADDSMFLTEKSPSPESMPSSPIESEPEIPARKLSDSSSSDIEQSANDFSNHTVAGTVPFASFTNRPRLPSPSDAAMVKMPTFKTACTTSTAEVLGEKTGKYEFFAAREDNRAAFMFRPKSPPISAIRETLVEDKGASETSNGQDVDVHTVSATSKPHHSDNLSDTKGKDVSATVHSPKPIEPSPPSFTDMYQPSYYAASGDKFINSPSVEPAWTNERTWLQSPDFDMTSAYTFQQSKLAKKTDPTIRRVQIQDLLAQEPRFVEPEEDIEPAEPDPQSTPNDASKAHAGSKRTFNDAFTELEDTHHGLDADLDGVIVLKLPASRASQADQPMTTSSQPEQESAPVVVEASSSMPVQQRTIRPAKRRRFAEVAACVALGGASVLSALIMSAPTFT